MDIFSNLIESLENCVAACNNCAAACLDEDNVQALTECIKLDLDCGDICQVALKLLIRDTNYAINIVEICKNICAECAAECEKHSHDHCQLCAKACRRCESHCRNFLNSITETVSDT